MGTLNDKRICVVTLFRKVTDFNECVTVYGTDVNQEDTTKGPSTKFQFHINAEEPLIDLMDQIVTQKEKIGSDDEQALLRALGMPVKRLFFELYVTCREARKWGCSENYIVQK